MLGGKAEGDVITNAGQRATSAVITPLAILIIDGVGKGKLGGQVGKDNYLLQIQLSEGEALTCTLN